jgi:plasmid replication initiation protein
VAIRTTKKDADAQKALQYVANDPKRTPGERWITMSNALTRAGHGLTLAEKRIVMMAVSKIDSTKPINPTEPPRTKITAAEYAAECGVDINTAYDQLQSAAKHIYSRSVMFYEPAHKRNGQPITPGRTVMRWVGQIEYHQGEGWVELHWWPALIKHLMGLKRQFTSYQLQQASALRSVYSWRLLELLTRFESTGWAEYTIEDFAASMDATDKQRSDFAAIRRKIIEPAIKELQDKDGWLISWQPIKAGRKVKALRFEFKRNPQMSLF